MNLADLSPEDQALVMAFTEIATQECEDRTWAELEPQLAACWEDQHRAVSAPPWDDISAIVRRACEEAGMKH